MDFLRRLFGAGDYMPHGFCYLWNSRLVWLHVASDSLIALSYFAIPAILLWLVRKRRDLPFSWMFVLFGVFIVACGTTHVMEVWTLWHANYWLSGIIKAITAAASTSTAVFLTQIAPKVFELPAFGELLQSKTALERQVSDLQEGGTQALMREAAYRGQAALLDLTHDAIFFRDTQSKINYWNRAAEELYGWRRHEVAGKGAHEILRTEFPKPLAEIEAEVLENGSWEGELVHYTRTGKKVVVDSRWAADVDATGNRIGILESNRDISARKRMERRFEKLLESAPDGVVIVNQSGKIELVNARAEDLFGYCRSELVGQPVEVLVPDQFRAIHSNHREGYTNSPRARDMGLGLELFGRRKDGTQFPVEISLSPIESEHGTLISSSIRDVSLRHEATRQIQNLNAALEQKVRDLDATNKELESFSYSVSHDLRAPLRHIDGFARILIEEHASAFSMEARHFLERIVEAANRMGTLIDDLLSLARVGRREMAVRKASLDNLVQQAMTDLPPGTENRGILWRIEPLGEAVCDSGLIKLAFYNLLANAVKFTRTRETAMIQIGTRQMNGTTAYFVQDNGVGFDSQYADKLFGVFQRLHGQQEFEGTGVGLATVRRIVQRHGGEVWAESRPGEGATFFFTLAPRLAQEPANAEVANRDGQQAGRDSSG